MHGLPGHGRLSQPLGQQRGLAEARGGRKERQPGAQPAVQKLAQPRPPDDARPRDWQVKLGCNQRAGHKPGSLVRTLTGIKPAGRHCMRNSVRYSVGVTPTYFLNTREKYCDDWKPFSMPMAVIESEVLVRRSQQRLIRTL